MIAKENATKIEKEIQYLSMLRDSARGYSDSKNRNYSSFWAQVKEIDILFKSLKPLSREDREKLWNEKGSLCASVKEEIEETNKKRMSKSYGLYAQIHEYLYTYCMVDCFPNYPRVENLIENGKCLKKAGIMLHENKAEMLSEHKQMIFNEMQDIQRSHDIWWGKFRSEREQKQSDFESRIKANLETNYSRHRSATDALRRVQANAEDLRSKIASGGSDEWVDRWAGWLSESEDKIQSIERYIQQVEEWIEEDEKKLNR